jgi:hypothetical protein
MVLKDIDKGEQARLGRPRQRCVIDILQPEARTQLTCTLEIVKHSPRHCSCYEHQPLGLGACLGDSALAQVVFLHLATPSSFFLLWICGPGLMTPPLIRSRLAP